MERIIILESSPNEPGQVVLLPVVTSAYYTGDNSGTGTSGILWDMSGITFKALEDSVLREDLRIKCYGLRIVAHSQGS